ncbi:MAG: type II toxin-antitoxin system Phd/YefM family antitoxin [Desulfobacterales bacterium]|nr:type II toxin-antitoxin system Phd/YefM family antitoxin [Desulfobacterales bacterium]
MIIIFYRSVAMEKHISATEAVRSFSEILNTISFNGTHYVIERNGKPIVSMRPVSQTNRAKTLKELKSIVENLPDLGEEAEAFAFDLQGAADSQPPLPENDLWA